MTEFSAVKLTDKVYWVGAIDWGLRDFHGYKTSRGTTYNAYLILTDKPILIDTVKAPFFAEMMARIRSVIAPEKISYIISNHAEMDHSGALLQTIAAIKPEKVFASKMGTQTLQQHFAIDFPLTEAKNNELLELGEAKFTFLETRMLHWPDSMFSFFHNDGVLFSQDGFGMHLATTELLATQHDRSMLHYEAAKYYANILLPYSQFVIRLLQQFPSFNLDLKMVAPDHGPIWNNRESIEWIINLWGEWARQKPTKKVVISYDTMWNSTATMAKAIADGVMAQNCPVKVLPLQSAHRSDIVAELLEAGALLIGSPTLNQQLFPTVAELICYLKGLKPQNLIGQAFGSYGWGGEAVKILQNEIFQLQIASKGEAVKVKYVPTVDDLSKCNELGKIIAESLNE